MVRLASAKAWALVLGLCWLATVWHAYRGGFDPGFIDPPQDAAALPYPWSEVSLTALHTLAYVVIAFLIVRPGGARRVAAAFGVSVALLVYHFATLWTDLPGYAYTPIRAALLLTVVLGIGTFVELLRRGRLNKSDAM